MKYGKRIIAFALSAVVAFGAVTYRQPKAHAVVGSMLANMCLSTYMTATGISLVPDTATAEAIASALDSLIPDFVKDYAQEVGDFTVDAFKNTIQDGCVIRTTGQLQIAHTAAALMGRFTAWLINKFSLVGEDGTPVSEPIGILPSSGTYLSFNGKVVHNFTDIWEQTTYPYAVVVDYNGDKVQLRFTTEPLTYSGNNFISSSGKEIGIQMYYNNDYGWELRKEDVGTVGQYADKTLWSNYNIYNTYDGSGSVYLSASELPYLEDWDNPSLSAVLSSNYEVAPDVDEQHAIVINTGIPFADEQSYIDSILNGVASGTLTPTYTVEQATGGDVVVPDEDEDESGILNWVKSIAQDVKALPRTIADAVADVFVPSEEYLATLPETVANTFDNRTGFLTYPASVLHDFIQRITTEHGDFILRWPQVKEPYSKAVLLSAGEFNVSKFVRDNAFAVEIYTIYKWVISGYMTFLFLDLCRKKYNSVIGDRLVV